MKAAVLKAFGSPLVILTWPDPVLGIGEVIVDVIATGVRNYANEVLSGERKYLLELPVVPGPGAIGRIKCVLACSTTRGLRSGFNSATWSSDLVCIQHLTSGRGMAHSDASALEGQQENATSDHRNARPLAK